MPTPEEILAGLTLVANDAQDLAVAWHLVVALGLGAWLAGMRPSRRIAGLLLALPLASTAGAALAYHNPFNAVLVGTIAVVLALVARGLGATRVEGGPRAYAIVGAALVAFAWVYPHFFRPTTPVFAYVYASPMGLVPCPSLALVAGLTLLAGGLGSRAWCVVLGVAASFYGLFGVLRLGVLIDVGLLVGALALLAVARDAGRVVGDANARA